MIYTLTYQRALNFGAVLQAYALAKFLNNQGYETQVIDYLPLYMHLQTKRPMKSIGGTIDKYKKYKKFAQFRAQFLPLTQSTYYSNKALAKLPNPEALIVGSDQVWNPNLHGKHFDTSFLFDFKNSNTDIQTSSNTKKLAYAASAGSVRFTDVTNDKVNKLLHDFTAIGCREGVLKEDIDSLLKADTDVVLDPSLLLQDYSEVEDKSCVPDHDYLVSYVVGSGEMLSTFNERVEEAKALFGLPVIHIGAKAVGNADENRLDIGPSQWFTLIKNAKFVVTNSFHGCAFSVNFQKQFIAIPHKLTELNQRQKTLLQGVGLSSRLLDDGQKLTQVNTNLIDYEPVSAKLSVLVQQSREFLLRHLDAG